MHSDLLLLAVPIPSLLAHVLPITWRALKLLLITLQSLWSWFLVKAQVVKLFFRCKVEKLLFETALSSPPFFVHPPAP